MRPAKDDVGGRSPELVVGGIPAAPRMELGGRCNGIGPEIFKKKDFSSSNFCKNKNLESKNTNVHIFNLDPLENLDEQTFFEVQI